MIPTETSPWDRPGTERRRWRLAPAAARAELLPAGPAAFGPPGPDLVQVALAADARNDRREGLLGMVLAVLMLLALAEGWLLPALAAAFVAAPLIGIGLESWDAARAARAERQDARRAA